MPIIMMTSKRFIEDFIRREPPDVILDASFIIASERIKYGVKSKNQCMKALYPIADVIIKISDEKKINYKHNSEFIDAYYKQLDTEILTLATMVKFSMMKKNLVIILTTTKENRVFNHLKLIQRYVAGTFGYYIQEYNPKEAIIEQNIDTDILNKCNKVIKDVKKKNLKQSLKSVHGSRQVFSSMKKKKLKSLLKKANLYSSDMTKEEMIETCVQYTNLLKIK